MGHAYVMYQLKAVIVFYLMIWHICPLDFNDRNSVFKTSFFHFYFLIQDYSTTILYINMIPCKHVDNIYMKGTVSQIFNLGLSSNFISKNGEISLIFSNTIFYI